MLHYLHPFLWTQPALKKICSAVRRTKWRSRQWFRSWCRHENMGKNTLETWWFLGLMVASLLLLVHPWKMPFQISHLGRPFERARHSRGGTKCSTATLTFLLVVNIQFLSHIHFIMWGFLVQNLGRVPSTVASAHLVLKLTLDPKNSMVKPDMFSGNDRLGLPQWLDPAPDLIQAIVFGEEPGGPSCDF